MEKSIVFYKSYYDAIENAIENTDEKYEVIKTILEYAFEGKVPNYDRLSKTQRAIIIMAIPLIDSNAKKRAGGKLGGRPKISFTAKKPEQKPYEYTSPIYIPPDVEKRLQMKALLNEIRSE